MEGTVLLESSRDFSPGGENAHFETIRMISAALIGFKVLSSLKCVPKGRWRVSFQKLRDAEALLCAILPSRTSPIAKLVA